ncbi:MAG: ribonuclease BN/unknown domain fusion protein [Bacteroidetes bacterium]|jgi:membrane protein|nr:ribonuclease BN/unknown domain fusion protein [Bacteroidota bacterium]
MSGPVSFFKKSQTYVSEQLWKVRLDKMNKRRGFVIKHLRVLSLALKGFRDDNCLTTATALTFYTLFSIVPVIALIFAIAKGFGIEKDMEVMILKKYETYSEVLNNAFVYANKMLSTAKGGIIAGFGIVLLLWSVMKLLMNIENSFNAIWEVKRGRSWVRKLTDYLTIMLVGPVFMIVSGGLTVAIQAQMGNISMLGFFGTILVKLFAYSLVAGVFTFIYMALPNTKVNFKSAFAAGIIATILFEILGWGYLKFQIGASRLSTIYGGFAALPLFLIWVQYSWYLVLFGAQVSYAHQNIAHFELEEDIKNLSFRYKKVISLMIAHLVAKSFYNGDKSFTASGIATRLDLPLRLAKNVINDFVETGIFVEVRTETDKEIVYQPGVTESKFTVKYLFDKLEQKGVNSIPIEDTAELIHINKLMSEMDNALDTDLGRQKIKDIVI